jgi:hypothetical protein
MGKGREEGREGLGGKGKEIEGRRRGMGKRGGEGRGKPCIGPPPFSNPRYATVWEHAIFGPPPNRNPLTDRYEILNN